MLRPPLFLAWLDDLEFWRLRPGDTGVEKNLNHRLSLHLAGQITNICDSNLAEKTIGLNTSCVATRVFEN